MPQEEYLFYLQKLDKYMNSISESSELVTGMI